MAKKLNKVNETDTNNVPSVAEQDATLNAVAAQDTAQEAPKDDDSEIVTVTLSNAHKTATAIILKKGSTDSVQGKERWFAKKDLNAFKLENGKWQVSAPRRYFTNKLVAFTEASE